MDNFIKIDIPHKCHLASLIRGYATTFDAVTNLRCESIVSDKEQLELEINFGKNYLDYKYKGEEHIIIIDYQEVGDPVGTYYSAEKFEKLIVMIEYNKENYKLKKECISQFIRDAKNYYNKKDDNEIICKILKSGYWSLLSKLPKEIWILFIYLRKIKKIL